MTLRPLAGPRTWRGIRSFAGICSARRRLVPCAGPGSPQITQMAQIGPPTAIEERDRQTYLIIGAAMEVHRHLGSGFLEPVYQAALEAEFDARTVSFAREVELQIQYKGRPLSVRYRADFICFGEVLVELKAMERLTDRDDSQVINYLAASKIKRGLLLNFGASSLQFRRFVGPGVATTPSAQSVKSVGPLS